MSTKRAIGNIAISLQFSCQILTSVLVRLVLPRVSRPPSIHECPALNFRFNR